MGIIGFRAAVERALPGTIPEIMAKSGMTQKTVRQWLRIIRAEGGCHAMRWVPIDVIRRGAQPFYLEYVAGPGDEPPIQDLHDWLIHLVLIAMPGTRRDIEDRTGLSKNTVFRMVEELHSERCRWVRICGWERPSKGPWMPRFSVSKGPDAPCTLEYLTEAEKSRRHRNKALSDGRWADRNRRVKARNWAKRAGRVGDPLVNALFGQREATLPTVKTEE